MNENGIDPKANIVKRILTYVLFILFVAAFGSLFLTFELSCVCTKALL